MFLTKEGLLRYVIPASGAHQSFMMTYSDHLGLVPFA